MRLTLKSYWPGVVWFLLSCVAFFIPGAALPDEEWFSILEIDKLVHVFLFASLVILWCLPAFHRSDFVARKLLLVIPLIFFGYSIAVEIIQHFFIPGRSFDLADIVADALGCSMGFFLMRWYFLRTRPDVK